MTDMRHKGSVIVLYVPYSIYTVWSIYDIVFQLAPAQERGIQIRNCFFVFVIPRWKMVYEMTNLLIWSDFEIFFFYFQKCIYWDSQSLREKD